MYPGKTLLLVLLILSIVIICRAELNLGALKTNQSYDLVKEAAVKIITNCHETGANAIGIGGNSAESLITTLTSGKTPIPVILLSNTLRTIDSGPVTGLFRYRLQIFAITVSSSAELKDILMDVKKSRWWNHMANFYILYWPISEDGCSRAHEILSIAWRMNLLEAKFLCVHATKGRLIYGFNPYTSDAPDPWQLEKIYQGENDHPWTLLVRGYRNDRDLCENMNFDKTNDLGGYEIRASVRPESRTFYFLSKNETPVDTRNGYTGHIIRSLFDVTNATVKLMLLNGDAYLKTVLENSDIFLSNIAMKKPKIYLEFFMTYPHWNDGVFIVTLHRGYKSQLDKLASVLDWTSRIGVCLVIIVNVIFMKYFLRKNLSVAMLDTARLFFNSCLVKLPITAGSRIYLTSLLLFMITILGIYQGKLAALLSQQKPIPDIESESDLVKFDLKIYGPAEFAQALYYQTLKERFIRVTNFNCTEKLLLDPHSAACLLPFGPASLVAARFKLHLSKQPIFKVFIVFPIRDDWPMEQRFNGLMQRLVEANLFRYMIDKSLAKPSRTIESHRNEGMDEKPKVLTLNDLSFAFAILGIGLSAATICFIIETIIDRRVLRLRIARIFN